MLIILVVLACIVGFFWNLFHGNFADAGVLFALVAILVFFARWVGKEKERSVEFLTWIKEKQEDLKKGWGFYRGQKITLNTEVTQYLGCISFIIMTSRFRSRFLIVGNGNALEWCLFSGLTFWFGWWGFPWGFIFTPQALYRNLRGGYRQPVGTLLANIDAEIDKLTNKNRKKLSTILSEAKAEARA